jgi:hypothetical protein
VLFLLGRDVSRAAQTGPRWKRRLLLAALAALSAAGAYAGGKAFVDSGGVEALANVDRPEPPDPPPAEMARMPLTETPPWQRLLRTWREADDVTSGRKGQYPFDARGRDRLLAALERSRRDLTALEWAWHLSPAEADLLRKGLARLAEKACEFRTTEERNSSCYAPALFTPAGGSLQRLNDRLPLLESLARTEKVHAAALGMALAAVQADLAMLADPKQFAQLPPADQPKAEAQAQRAKAAVAAIKARAAGAASAPAAETPQAGTE